MGELLQQELRSEWASDVDLFAAAASPAERNTALLRIGSLLAGGCPQLLASLKAAEPMVTKQVCRACEQDISDEAREYADTLLDLLAQHRQTSWELQGVEEVQLLLAPVLRDMAWVGELGLQQPDDDDGQESCRPWSCTVRVPTRDSHRNWKEDQVPTLLWPASLLCADLLLVMPFLARGRRVLEIGCGSHSLVAKAAAHVGATSVLTTDIDAAAVYRTASCVERARLQDVVRVAVLDWNEPDACEELQRDDRFDLVLAADCVHFKEAAAPLVALFQKILAPGGVGVLVGGVAKHRYGMEEFDAELELAAQAGVLEVRRAPVPPELLEQFGTSNPNDLHSSCISYGIHVVRLPSACA